MGKNVDEDLIEATIRRVAEEKAAKEVASVADMPPDDASAVLAQASGGAAETPSSADEAQIEETIRRVAAEKAAKDASANTDSADGSRRAEGAFGEELPREDDDAAQPLARVDEARIQETIARVTQERAGHAAIEQLKDAEPNDAAVPRPHAWSTVPDALPDIATANEDDEERIEETVRRVASAKSAATRDPWGIKQPDRALEPGDAAGDLDAPDGDGGEAPQDHVSPGEESPRPGILRVARGLAPPVNKPLRAFAGDDATADGNTPVERELAAIHDALEAIVRRLDAAMSLLERLAAKPAAPPITIGRTAQRPLTEVPSPEAWKSVLRTPPADAPGLQTAPPGASPSAAAASRFAETEEEGLDDDHPANDPMDAPTAAVGGAKRGLELLPRTYRITVEDKRRGVDLVPLHRALLAMEGVRDMSLLSYTSGTAIVSLETASGIDPEALERAVSRAMSRDARAEVHNENSIVVKLAEA